MARGVGGVSPANIMKHLGGVDFPANKQQLIEHARNKDSDAPDTDAVIGVLEQISDKEYDSPAEVLKEVGKVE